MPRLFTALEIPRNAAMSLSLLRGGLPGARWIDVENYHITLRFIGDIDGRTADEVVDRLDRIDRPEFQLNLTGMGSFGSRSRIPSGLAFLPRPKCMRCRRKSKNLPKDRSPARSAQVHAPRHAGAVALLPRGRCGAVSFRTRQLPHLTLYGRALCADVVEGIGGWRALYRRRGVSASRGAVQLDLFEQRSASR